MRPRPAKPSRKTTRLASDLDPVMPANWETYLSSRVCLKTLGRRGPSQGRARGGRVGRLELDPPPEALPGRGPVGGLSRGCLGLAATTGVRPTPLPSGPPCYLACTAATSTDGAGMRWAQIAHRAPDERPGFDGRRTCLRPHKSLNNSSVAHALDTQAVTHNLPEPQQVSIGGSGEILGAEGHCPDLNDERPRSCCCG